MGYKAGGDTLNVHIESAEAGVMGGPGGGATEVTLAQIKDLLDTALPVALGQALAAASIPVVIASNQDTRKWEMLGEQKISAAGAQSATLPAGTTIILITATTASVPYKQNGVADADSFPVAAGCVHVLGPETLASFSVFIANGAVSNLKYYKEA